MLSPVEIDALAKQINAEYKAVHLTVRVNPGVNGVVQTPTGIYFRLQLGTPKKFDRAGNPLPSKRITVEEAQTMRMLTQLENSLGDMYREFMQKPPRNLRNVPEQLVSFVKSPACVVLPYLEDVPPSYWQPEYAINKKTLELVIGMNYTPNGQYPVIWDKRANWHLLVAGTTNSGKTSAVVQITASFLWTYSPEELELIVIDPKNSMSAVFNTFPHCRQPVAFLPVHFDRCLYALHAEMDRRIAQGVSEPHLLVVIDELTDVVEHSKDNQEHLFIVARKGREVGITFIFGIHKPLTDIMGQAASQFVQRLVFRMRTPAELNAASGATKLSPFRLNRPGICYSLDQHGVKLTQSFMLGKKKVEAIRARWQSPRSESVLAEHLRRLDDLQADPLPPINRPVSRGKSPIFMPDTEGEILEVSNQQSGPESTSEVLLSVGSTDKAPYQPVYVNSNPANGNNGRVSLTALAQEKLEARANFRKLCDHFGTDVMYGDKLPSYRRMLQALGLPDGGPQYDKNRAKLAAALACVGAATAEDSQAAELSPGDD